MNTSDPEFKSKSQLKRESLALQELGEELVKLSEQALAKLPLDDELAKAIHLAQSISSRSALRRQLQYIGRLMREGDVEPIQKALAVMQHQDQKANAEFHRLEKWRDRLIAEGDAALAELLAVFPQADRQHLRHLLQKAQQELKAAKPPQAARALFRYLRDLYQGGFHE